MKKEEKVGEKTVPKVMHDDLLEKYGKLELEFGRVKTHMNFSKG